MFSENGPVSIDANGKQSDRPTAWNLHGMDVLYVDSPVGAGYSYNDNGTLQTSVRGAMESLLVALGTALTSWQPHLQDQNLVLAGESFAGRWIPTLAALMVRHQRQRNSSAGTTSSAINFKLAGVAIGSGWTSPTEQAQCIPAFAYNAGRCDLDVVVAGGFAWALRRVR